jgi:hypothetical protein
MRITAMKAIATRSDGLGPESIRSTVWLSTVGECQREMMGFVLNRTGKDLEAMHKMLCCKSPSDVLEVQSQWFRRTIEDDTSELIRILTICMTHQPIFAAKAPARHG